MDDKQIRDEIRKAAEATQTVSRIPSFDETWVIAEAEVAQSKAPRRYFGGWLAAAAVLALAVCASGADGPGSRGILARSITHRCHGGPPTLARHHAAPEVPRGLLASGRARVHRYTA